MKVSVKFTGRKAGALGLTDWIGSFEGSGETVEQAIDAARMAAYDAGYEHLMPQMQALPSTRTWSGWHTSFEIVYKVIPEEQTDLRNEHGVGVASAMTAQDVEESYKAMRDCAVVSLQVDPTGAPATMPMSRLAWPSTVDAAKDT